MERGGVRFHWKEQVATCHAPVSGDIELTLTSGRRVAMKAEDLIANDSLGKEIPVSTIANGLKTIVWSLTEYKDP